MIPQSQRKLQKKIKIREDLKRRQTEDRSKKFYRTADGGNYLKDKDDRKS